MRGFLRIGDRRRVPVATRTTVMGFVTMQDGAEIFYKDWGTGQPIVLSHGWPLNADSWDAQMLFLASHATAASPTTAVVMVGRPRRGTATRWTRTPTTWRR